jgi:hypothetical protein
VILLHVKKAALKEKKLSNGTDLKFLQHLRRFHPFGFYIFSG